MFFEFFTYFDPFYFTLPYPKIPKKLQFLHASFIHLNATDCETHSISKLKMAKTLLFPPSQHGSLAIKHFNRP